jgi:hypothetical protein
MPKILRKMTEDDSLSLAAGERLILSRLRGAMIMKELS